MSIFEQSSIEIVARVRSIRLALTKKMQASSNDDSPQMLLCDEMISAGASRLSDLVAPDDMRVMSPENIAFEVLTAALAVRPSQGEALPIAADDTE